MIDLYMGWGIHLNLQSVFKFPPAFTFLFQCICTISLPSRNVWRPNFRPSSSVSIPEFPWWWFTTCSKARLKTKAIKSIILSYTFLIFIMQNHTFFLTPCPKPTSSSLEVKLLLFMASTRLVKLQFSPTELQCGNVDSSR